MIERTRYEQVRAVIVAAPTATERLTYTQLAEAAERSLTGGFVGSVRWYVTAVKLDLGARGELRRIRERGHDYVALAGEHAGGGERG